MSKNSVKVGSKRKRSVPSKLSKKEASDSEHNPENEEASVDPLEIKITKKMAASKSKSSVEKSEQQKKAKQEQLDFKALYHKSKSGGFVCKLCSEKFSHRHKVHTHIRSKHQQSQFHQCSECPQRYKSKYQLKMHMNTHSENQSDHMVFCDKCDYRASNKYYLKQHEIRRHSTDYPFECDHCKKKFKVKMDLKFHLGTHSDSKHMCDICGKMYSSPESLYKHRKVMHINEYKFKCPHCCQKLLSQKSLDQHLELHKNLHNCDECELKFTKKYYLTRHKKRVHMVEKNNLCPVCGKSFVCMATLRVHYLTHAKVKPYMCNVCGFSFTQRSSMMLHWKRKHPEAEAPPPPVILTNFFDSFQSEVQKLVEPTIGTPPKATAVELLESKKTDGSATKTNSAL